MTKLLIILILIGLIFFNVFQIDFKPKILINKNYIFYDIHDKDYKKIIFNNNNNITILPFKSNKKWIVHSNINNKLRGEVNFNVKGKPNPPPINIEIKFSFLQTDNKYILVALFFDPTGKISLPNIPLNIWYNIN